MRERRQHSGIACAGAALLSVISHFAAAQSPHRGSPSAGDPPLRPFHLNFNRFEIPFSVDQLGQPPVEVQLYVSRDAGSQWELFASQGISGKPFLFEAPNDGVYWFATRTVDNRGNAAALRPQLTVRVDTTDPQVDLQATITPSGAIAVTLLCIDAAPSAESIRVEYSIDQSRQWTLVPDISGRTEAGDAGRLNATAEFLPPGTWHQISIRAEVGDLAGNKTTVARQVDKPRIAAGPMRLATSKAASNASSTIAASPTPTPTPATVPSAVASTTSSAVPSYARAADARIANHTPWAVPQFAASSGIAAAEPSAGPIGTVASDPAESTGPELRAPELTAPVNSQPPGQFQSQSHRAAAPIPLTPAEPSPPPRPKTAAEAMRPLMREDSTPPAALPTGAAPSAVPMQRPAERSTTLAERSTTLDAYAASVPTRHSRSRKFSLEYEVESAGLAGVSDVELWGTTDRGQTWKRWGADPDRESPFDIETNNDGTYGFRIVVVAGNGLATPRPLSGDPADILVVVDTEPPRVRITGATYGDADQTGSLVIRYQCDDANLMRRPISLSFSNTPNGPWSTIAAGLENDGVYVWPADPNLPRQIYLRIDATDMAGNVANYTLDTPIDIQGLAPRARIRGFNPLTGSPGGTPGVRTERAGAHSEPPQTATQPTARFK